MIVERGSAANKATFWKRHEGGGKVVKGGPETGK